MLVLLQQGMTNTLLVACEAIDGGEAPLQTTVDVGPSSFANALLKSADSTA